jgi:hypothetical protein
MSRRRDRLHRSNDHARSVEVLQQIGRKHLEYDPLLDPWERQPTESARNHGFFLMYRDLGRIRSVAQVAEMTPLTYGSMTRLARFNKWVERAGQWDAEQDRIQAIRLHDKREEMAVRHAKAASLMMTKALARLETLNIKDISPHALILMLQTAAQIERAALGLENMRGGAAASQTAVTVAATTTTDDNGQPAVRVEVGVQHDQIMASLDRMVQRMSPEQLAAGYEELTESAKEALAGIDAALPAPPPQ